MTTRITRKLLDELTATAKAGDRLRKNHNFHEHYDEVCQRLLNAIEPGSYIRPHRHLSPPKPETFVALRGRMVLVTFEEDGTIGESRPLRPRPRDRGDRYPRRRLAHHRLAGERIDFLRNQAGPLSSCTRAGLRVLGATRGERRSRGFSGPP